MEKILITYATRPLGLRIAKLLSASFEIEKTTSDEIPSVLKSAYTAIPRGQNPTYAHELLKLALDKACQYVLPLGKEKAFALAETSLLFEEYGIQVLCPPKELLAAIDCLSDPPADLQLSLLRDKKDMISGEVFADSEWNGLCIVSDSGDDFVLVTV